MRETQRTSAVAATALLMLVLLAACSKPAEQAAVATDGPRPSILLVTLDTTRADSIGPEAVGVETPSFNALAARGLRFRYAYATVPQTLPSHSSMMTGLYPAGHHVHENGRFLDDSQPRLAERLRSVGYRTAAFVSAFAVAKRFGLGAGFEVYDEEFGEGRAERNAKETTDRVLSYLQQASPEPLFLWVHYYDPHYPYTPPEPFASRYTTFPYQGEIAFMDEQLGLLVRAFEQRSKGGVAIVVVADHGEGLGEHGEAQHGNLLYQSTMHVPLVLVGPVIRVGMSDTPVSTRKIFHTVLDWAGVDSALSLRGSDKEEVIAGEAMKPFLDYGWQPQVMAIQGKLKTIKAGRIEVYDVVADPHETHDLASQVDLSRSVRATLRDYPLPTGRAAEPPANIDEEAQRKLASLGYVSASAKPVIRADAPNPVDMASLFPMLDQASGLFVREQYAAAIPLLEQIQAKDPNNLDAALRLASAHSALGHDQQALMAFKTAESIAPDSSDVRTYLALHYAKGKEWQRAMPLLERITIEEPERLPPLEALAMIRERQGRFEDAVTLRQKIYTMRAPSPLELVRLGQLQMRLEQTTKAVESFERARSMQGDAFSMHLELGVLYLAAGRFVEARQSLDRVSPSDSSYPMALFKRAQVSVLLHEADQAAHIAAARENADGTTRALIASERLFQ